MARTPVLMLVALLTTAAEARAEIAVGSSLEWLTCDAELVVGRVEKIVQTPVPHDIGSGVYHEITVVVKEAIKGKAKIGERVVFHMRTQNEQYDAVPAAWMRSNEPTLLFLSTSKKTDHNLDGKLVPTPHQQSYGIDLAAPRKEAFDGKGQILVKKDAILTACRDTAKKLADHLKMHPNGRAVAKQIDAGSTPAGKVLWAGSAVMLTVPEFVTEPKK